MIEADDDVPRLQRPHEDAADEVLRLYRGDGAGEDDDHGRVDPRPGDQLEPLLEGRNRNGRALGLQHLERVRIEAAREGSPVPITTLEERLELIAGTGID